MMRALILALGLIAAPVFTATVIPSPAFAVQPDEILDDPVLEARARGISAGLRCPVCQNESIDESSAPVSRDLRIIVRERLVAGDTDEEIIDFVVARYGEFVLLRPDASGINLILWIAGPAMLIVAGAIGWVTIRRRATALDSAPLSVTEEARLRELLNEK